MQYILTEEEYQELTGKIPDNVADQVEEAKASQLLNEYRVAIMKMLHEFDYQVMADPMGGYEKKVIPRFNTKAAEAFENLLDVEDVRERVDSIIQRKAQKYG
jgi:hypothetical protein